MMDTLLFTLLALTCRASVALPIAIVIYLVWQRQRRGIPLYPQFIFWFAVAAALFVALQWIDGPAWLHVIIFGFWGTALMTCILAGLKEIEEASIEIAKAAMMKQSIAEQGEADLLRKAVADMVASHMPPNPTLIEDSFLEALMSPYDTLPVEVAKEVGDE
jgi:hypothetical protein